ncbi:MAG: hypothetical protein AOA65_0152 [Candidatus Bathyarchaeota archaeon BA1]|nr:MAG: hypothetical protein AOA65_0152 [Candidatus Bathyarchaeota archaeon BA1]
MTSSDWLAPFSEPPASTLFILFICVLISFAVSLANRFLINREQVAAWRREIAAWNADLNKAKRTGDKRLMAKVERRKPAIMKMQAQMASQSMKVTGIFFVPFLLIWLFLTGRILVWQLFTTPFTFGKIVAYLPWFGGTLPLDFSLWYIICSFLFSTLFSRILGVTTESE